MKNFTKIVGITVTVAVIGLSFASCADDEKKAANAAGAAQTIGAVADAVGAGKAVEAAKNAIGNVTAAASGGAPTVAPAADFRYGLTSDSKGVKINKYNGSGGNIIVPDTIDGFPVTEFAASAFLRTAVTSVVLPDSLVVTNYDSGRNLFGDCAQLQAVTFPKGITLIPNNWFKNCTALTSITIPDTVTEITSGAFENSGLTSIVIPEGVTLIDDAAFVDCKNLTSVTLPESIENLRSRVFTRCANLETVNLPAHKIAYSPDFGHAFEGCSKLPLATQKAIRDTGYTGPF